MAVGRGRRPTSPVRSRGSSDDAKASPVDMPADCRGRAAQPGVVVRSLAHNTAFLSLSDVAGKASAFVFFLFAARRLGTDEFGVLSFALGFVTMFSVLVDMGLGQLAVRTIARDRDSGAQLVGLALPLKAVSSVLLAALIIAFAFLFGYPSRTLLVVLACCPIVLDAAFTQFFRGVFQGLEATWLIAVARVLQAVLVLVALATLSRWLNTAFSFASLNAGVVVLVSAFTLLVGVNQLGRPSWRVDVRQWGTVLRAALPLGVSAILIMFYYWNGSTLLSLFSGNRAVGIYNASYPLVFGLTFLSSSYAGALYPIMSRAHATGAESVAGILARGLGFILPLAVCIVVVGSFSSAQIVQLVYGSQFAQSASVLRVLAWWGTLMYINAVMSHLFIATDRSSLVTAQAGLNLGVNLGLNFLLIPHLGAVGAAVAIVAAEALGVSFYIFLIARSRVPGFRGEAIVRTVLLCLLSAAPAVSVALLAGRLHAVIAPLASTIVYVLFLRLFGVVSLRQLLTAAWSVLRR